jgi:hypothetical protein
LTRLSNLVLLLGFSNKDGEFILKVFLDADRKVKRVSRLYILHVANQSDNSQLVKGSNVAGKSMM